ncbi:undecaprenyl-diphosphatase [Marinococcus luteus]|uniref:Undecaprenyl-diphosphatase n=1 Tax=Marinococcus luteus TaxID=1122204 RepID=A0A1H2Q0G7_9BACI|nr:phosphatase PAP2 family protein [Marinococcus luteus]SDW00613.1 undecaprenyl-diphosphatase [Marinococcus luteus]
MSFKGLQLSDVPKSSWILIIAGLLTLFTTAFLFLEMGEEVLEQETFMIDQTAQNIVSALNTDVLQSIMGLITEAGSVSWLTAGAAVITVYLLFFSSFSRWNAVYFAVNMIGISIITTVFKNFFSRQRPEVLAAYDGTGYSFPSGHATGAVTFYGFLAYLVIRSTLAAVWKWLLGTLLTLAALLVAVSRMFLDVHYFTDVLAGISVGLFWLLICIIALELTLWNKYRRQI